MSEEKKVVLSIEEVQGLLEGREVSILEDVSIRMPDCLETRRIMDILTRYDNGEYWLQDEEYGDDFEEYEPLNV